MKEEINEAFYYLRNAFEKTMLDEPLEIKVNPETFDRLMFEFCREPGSTRVSIRPSDGHNFYIQGIKVTPKIGGHK